jgi:hypothetical protein
MSLNRKLETAVESMISASYATNNVTNWTLVNSYSTGSLNGNENPSTTEIFITKSEPMMPYVHLGYDRVTVTIATVAVKSLVTASEFETVSDYTFNPFLTDDALTTLSSYAPTLIIKSVVGSGLEITSVNDVWMATQDLEVIAGHSS